MDNARRGFIGNIEHLALREALPRSLKALVDFAYETSWRKAEALGLTWDRVDLAARTARLDTRKNDKGRLIVLTESLAATLRAAREETAALEATRLRAELAKVEAKRPKGRALDEVREQAAQRARVPWVFHRNGRRIRDFRKAWTNACATAKVAGLVFHDLRRSGIRNMVRAGISERVAMTVSGHKTRSVFDRDNIVSKGDLRDATRKLEAARKGQESLSEIATAPTLDPNPTQPANSLLKPSYGNQTVTESGAC